MFKNALSEDTQSALALLTQRSLTKGFYLAGGTALALQFGHRLSIDLDFFTPEPFDQRSLALSLKEIPGYREEQKSQWTILGFIHKTQVSFFRYPYPLILSALDFEGSAVADPRDIGCMKIEAISSRGLMRDFIDLYFICKKAVSLRELLKLFEKKYQGANYNRIHIMKSLTFFEDAEKNEMPVMIQPVKWVDVKLFFQREVPKLVSLFG